MIIKPKNPKPTEVTPPEPTPPEYIEPIGQIPPVQDVIPLNPALPPRWTPPYEDHTTMEGYIPLINEIKRNIDITITRLTGHPMDVFKLNRDGQRCPECTEPVTGNVLTNQCPKCYGFGYFPPLLYVGRFYGILQHGSTSTTATAYGTTEIARDQVVFTGNVPHLQERDLIRVLGTGDILKVLDSNPDLTALQGKIITQILNTTRMPRGDSVYDLMETFVFENPPNRDRKDFFRDDKYARGCEIK